MAVVSLRVNGAVRDVDVDPATPLLYVLRNDLNLRGPRFGCGLAQCGACTVIIDGVAMRSCITPVSGATGEITTLEGLSKDGDHPLQKAWCELGVPQCGFCQPGQVMSAAALLAATPKPTDAEIDKALGGNLCRCGCYQRIRQAVHMAAEAKAGGAR